MKLIVMYATSTKHTHLNGSHLTAFSLMTLLTGLCLCQIPKTDDWANSLNGPFFILERFGGSKVETFSVGGNDPNAFVLKQTIILTIGANVVIVSPQYLCQKPNKSYARSMRWMDMLQKILQQCETPVGVLLKSVYWVTY